MTASNLSSIRARALLTAALVLVGTSAWAADWRLVEMTGQVRIAAPGADVAAGRQGQTLPIGSSVTTFAGGRAVLDNGLQHIVVGPNSRMTLAPEQTSGMSRVVQDLGAILFQVDKKDKPHFRVETPLLAAVVKGTTFTVEVDALADSVNVAEGLVEVRSNLNNLGRDVPAGASGTIRRDAPMAVQLITLTSDAAPVSGPEPVSAALPPIDYKAASDGLIGGAVNAILAGGPQTRATEASATSTASALAEQPAQPAQAMAGAAVGGGGGGAPVNVLAAQVSGSETAAIFAGNGNGAPGLVGGAVGGVIDVATNVGGNGNSGSGNSGNGNGNGGSGLVGGIVGGVVDIANGNSGSGGGNGNGNNGNGNGNGGSGLGGGVVGGVVDIATGNSGHGGGNGNNGNGNGNGGSGLVGGLIDVATGDSGNGNSGKGGGNGNGNNGNGNGNGGSGLVGGVVGAVGGVVDSVTSGGGNSGNGNGNGNGGSGLIGGLLGGKSGKK